jgi:hypothetical protein
MASLAKDQKSCHQTAHRLRKGLESSKSKFKHLDCASDLRSLVTAAFQTLATLATHKQVEVKQHIIKELVGLSAGEACDKINEEEVSNFAACLMTETDNKGKELSDKLNAVEFTCAICQSAVVLCLCSKVGHKNQRELLPLAMPTLTMMNRLLCEMRLNGLKLTLVGVE